MSPVVSVQGNFMSVYSKNCNGENNLVQSIILNQGFFLCTGNQEEGFLGV